MADAGLHGVTPTQAWLEHKERRLAPVVQQYLECCLEQPFSFYEVERCEPGRGMTLCDLLTGERHEVCERTASQGLHAHDVIFAQLASADGVTLLEATCPVALPTGDKVPIIELRKSMRKAGVRHGASAPRIGAEQLREWEPELRELYLSLSERVLYPTLPTMVTADGEAMEFHKLTYSIDVPQHAFDALKHLDVRADDPEALDAGTQRDPDGAVRRATIDMARPGQDRQASSVSLWGTIQIDGHRLTAEVNSRECAERVKDTIAEVLGAHATFRADEVQTVEQALAKAREQPSRPSPQPSDDPEMQAMLAEHLERHYAEWLDAPLPALDGCSPRETATNPDGREQVAAMLQEAEGHNIGLPASVRKAIFDSVRLQLNLTD
ncbi:MAG TPA: hypothetical protein VFL63_13680 [Rhodanobacteraceae bacterium]|nr:hypothetical protein [Rhodanobacteraceae bacterium]